MSVLIYYPDLKVGNGPKHFLYVLTNKHVWDMFRLQYKVLYTITMYLLWHLQLITAALARRQNWQVFFSCLTTF